MVSGRFSEWVLDTDDVLRPAASSQTGMPRVRRPRARHGARGARRREAPRRSRLSVCPGPARATPSLVSRRWILPATISRLVGTTAPPHPLVPRETSSSSGPRRGTAGGRHRGRRMRLLRDAPGFLTERKGRHRVLVGASRREGSVARASPGWRALFKGNAASVAHFCCEEGPRLLHEAANASTGSEITSGSRAASRIGRDAPRTRARRTIASRRDDSSRRGRGDASAGDPGRIGCPRVRGARRSLARRFLLRGRGAGRRVVGGRVDVRAFREGVKSL